MHLHKKEDPCLYLEFSGPTYQLQLRDENGTAWVFLQLDQKGDFHDGFCDQEETESGGFCSHLQLAFQRIYNGHNEPLHQRFAKSLWNTLCRIFADRFGDNPDKLKVRNKGDYVYESAGGKAVFRVVAKEKKAIDTLADIIERQHADTEENSLKFSNLSQEELMSWREGSPTKRLKYELSFWSDFAKWLMLLEDMGEKHQITYGYSTNGLPNRLKVSFAEIEMSFYLSTANLPEIIPALASVKSALNVYHAPDEEIEKIVYDKSKGQLNIVPRHNVRSLQKDPHQQPQAKSISINGWIFVPEDGFYPSNPHELLLNLEVKGEEVSQLLNEHTQLVKNRIEGAKVHEMQVQKSYSLAFDTNWDLHIVSYIFSPGDMSSSNSKIFEDWVYLDDDGFYRFESGEFEQIETIIKNADIPDFITLHRTWLNLQEGFRVHIAPIQSQLTYHLSESGRLSFSRKLSYSDAAESKEFGTWVYIAGEGFHPKASSLTNTTQWADLEINSDQIPIFIRVNRDDLQMIPNFFSLQGPVESVALDVQLRGKGEIDLQPHYQLKTQYLDRGVRFFEDVSFVEGEGFFELPIETRLPEKFRHSTTVSIEDSDFFLAYELDLLRPFILNLPVQLKVPKGLHLEAEAIELQDNDLPGFLFKMKYATDYGSVLATELWAELRTKKHYFISSAGLIDLHDKRFNWLRWLQKKQIDKRKHTIRLSTIELIRLHAFEDVKITIKSSKEPSSAQQLLERLLDFEVPKEPHIESLKSILRPYQSLGLKWLWFLYSHQLSGLLCDDMGLGKTHQTMALIAAVQHELGQKKSPSFLVVCPTSVLYHWKEKLAAFLPHIPVYTYYGLERSIEDFMTKGCLLLTSYGIYRNEIERLKEIPFELAIFDEIQLAKNHNSRIYATLLDVNAKMRIGLTGTPIENNLRELKALFDLTLPLYMPSEADYKDFFVKPIEKENNKDRQKLLSKMIKPFVMRRKKEDVLADLPEKIEEFSHCDLSVEQAELYNQVLINQRERLIQNLEDESSSIPYMHIFALLSSLKQICNHPALFLKCPNEFRKYQSGKWDLFIELLEEARESDQKVVVYSQYLGMLDIIQDYLGELGVPFAGIRGSTTNRGEQLKRFQADPSCKVFVASLQAAGLGVDLTAASVVIHYDRWWNAAREDQATDRVHRIGQTRGVQVFKLITKDTFEERIDELIRNKRRLLEEVVSADEQDVVKQFSRQDLILLLKETRVKKE